jgi:hypothetical protein
MKTRTRHFVSALTLSLSACSSAGRSEASIGDTLNLQNRMDQFVADVIRRPPDSLISYFPTEGQFTYQHTLHSEQGPQTTVRQFSAGEVANALSGPLWEIFTLNMEGQTIGLFAHQAQMRRGRWRDVGSYRFVPPGADASSRTYVQWRSERGRWVISEVADEHFLYGPLPPWCC